MGGTPILSHFSPILAIQKNFTSVLTFLGSKFFFFFAKVPQYWSSFFKKIHRPNLWSFQTEGKYWEWLQQAWSKERESVTQRHKVNQSKFIQLTAKKAILTRQSTPIHSDKHKEIQSFLTHQVGRKRRCETSTAPQPQQGRSGWSRSQTAGVWSRERRWCQACEVMEV